MRQVRFIATADGYRSAKHATGMLKHEVHVVGCYLFGCNYKVSFVLTVLVVDHYHEFSLLEVLNSLLNCIKFQVFHYLTLSVVHFIYPLYYNIIHVAYCP